MNPIAWVFIGLFGATSLVHLFFCFTENEKVRAITKPFCLLLIAIFAAIAAPTHPFIYIGALFGAIGDAFLIKNKSPYHFVVGSICFIAGHLCYASEMILAYSFKIEWWWFLIFVGSLLLLMFALYPITKKSFGKIALIGNFYMPMLLILSFMGVIKASTSDVHWPGILFCVGYVFFLISDVSLTIATFKKDYKRRDFYIMLTYLIAEFLIVFALVGANVLV